MAHRLHVYTGDSKGKTTAAMGLALRALGHGQRVLVAQFLKDGASGEIRALRAFENARVWSAPPMRKFTFQMTPNELAAEAARQGETLQTLKDALSRENANLMVFDELAECAHLGLVPEEAALQLIEAALAIGETVVTGRDCPPALIARADYVSVIRAEKHPYQTEGLAAREGVEW